MYGVFLLFVLAGSMYQPLESKLQEHIICKLYALFEKIESQNKMAWAGKHLKDSIGLVYHPLNHIVQATSSIWICAFLLLILI